MEAFYWYWKHERFRSLGASGMRILFVLGRVKTEQRIRSMQAVLRELTQGLRRKGLEHEVEDFVDLFRFTRACSLAGDLIHGPLWHRGLDLDPSPFLAPPDRQLSLPFAAALGGKGPALPSGRPMNVFNS